MKKIYSLLGALAIIASSQAQNLKVGKAPAYKKVVATTSTNAAFGKTASAGNDTVGWQNYVDFLPQFAPSGNMSNFGYLGGGYVYGKNVDSINVCAAGFKNVSGAAVTIDRAVFLAVAKKSGSNATPSNLSVRLWDMAANKA